VIVGIKVGNSCSCTEVVVVGKKSFGRRYQLNARLPVACIDIRRVATTAINLQQAQHIEPSLNQLPARVFSQVSSISKKPTT
jgi:hypothetical protein